MPGQKNSKAPKRRRDGSKSSDVHHTDSQLFSSGPAPRKKQRTRAPDEELDFERRPRTVKTASKDNRLPVRTAQGWQRQDHVEEDVTVPLLSDGSDEDEQVQAVQADSHKTTSTVSVREEILSAKEELAKLAVRLNEDPEEHVGALRAMSDLSHSKNVTVKQLALATQCSVYRDIIPGYRIRPMTEADMTDKVSKEVKKLRAYEQSLVSGYKHYVQHLSRLAKGYKAAPQDRVLATTALSCASTLLLAVPHFNFRPDLLTIVMDAASRRASGADHELSIRTLQSLFEIDEDGKASLEAVQMLAKLMKTRDYVVTESMLNVFLHLRLLSEFGRKASYNRVDREDNDQVAVPKKIQRMQARRQYQTKRNRKLSKERKMLEKEMEEADAVVGHEERDKIQAEMLKLVFVCYFRILKAKTQHLMGAVLEGLARYAHLINQDFFADILEALKELIQLSVEQQDEVDDSEPGNDDGGLRDISRESLLCIVTAFALLQGQEGKAATTNLHLDLSFFIAQLYRTILPAVMDPDIEFSARSLHLPDPLDQSAGSREVNVNVKTKTVLLVRCLSSTLLPLAALRAVPLLRIAAFTKQLMTAAMQLPEKSCQAMLGLLAQTTKIHGKKIAGLWRSDERRGDGVFDALRGDVEGSNPFASTIWEGELLRLHYSPKVKEALKIIEANIRQSTS